MNTRVDSGIGEDESEPNTTVNEDEVFHDVVIRESETEDESGVLTEEEDTTKMSSSPDENKDKPADVAQNAVKLRFTKTLDLVRSGAVKFGIVLFIWLLGYFEFSLLWLLLGVFVFMWRSERQKKHAAIAQVSKEIAKDERKFLQTVQEVYKISGKDLPSWVYFPDIEKAEWLNKIVLQIWPYIGDYVKSMMEEQIQPSIQQSNSMLSSFKFAEVDLGDTAPRVVGVKVYGKEQTRRTEIVMDLHFVFYSDCNIKVSVNSLSAGIKNLQLKGQMRIELRPLIDKIPLVGAVSVAFLDKPFINFDLTDLGNFFDLPGIDSLLRGSIMDCICGLLVLPERYILKLADIDISTLKYPLPKGVLRIHIIEARNLEEKDRKILGIGGGSDPFVVVKVGRDQEFKTEIIPHSVDPTWNQSFDAVVHDVHGSTIEVALFDDDGALNKADDLGTATVPVKSVYKQGLIDEWIPLHNVTKGSIHVKLEWLEFSSTKTDVKLAMSEAKKYNLHSAFVNVYVDSAKEVVDVNESRYEPSPQLRVQFPNQSKPWKSMIKEDTANPVWEENCKSLIQNPKGDTIKFMVENNSKTGSGEILGELVVKTRQLLESPDMTKEEPFALTSGGQNAALTMRLTLRLLVPVGPKSSASDSSFVVTSKKKSTDDKLSGSLHSIIENEEMENESSVDPPPRTPVTPLTPVLNHSRTGSNSSNTPIKFDNRGPLNRSPSINSAVSDNSGSENLRQRLNDKLTNNGKENTTTATNKHPLGRLNLTLKYLKASETLLVEVHKAEKLIICDEDHKTSDPYVRIYLLPERKKRKKTQVIKNNLNPIFNETLKFDMTETELRRRQLEIAVKNETGYLSSEKVLMGQLCIDLGTIDFSSPVNKWYPLTVHPHSD